jgi:hypothetical protein
LFESEEAGVDGELVSGEGGLEAPDLGLQRLEQTHPLTHHLKHFDLRHAAAADEERKRKSLSVFPLLFSREKRLASRSANISKALSRQEAEPSLNLPQTHAQN